MTPHRTSLHQTSDRTAPGSRVRAVSAELRAVHGRLRDALDLARESVRSGAVDGTAPRDLLLYCWGFCAALTGHHGAEGAVLFAEVRAARPELGPVLDELARDHSMIDHLIGSLERAMSSGAPVPEVLRHLDGIDAVMESHFRFEERTLLGVLDDVEGAATHPPAALFGPLA